MSLTEADQDWFEKELEPPTNKSSIIQCTLEGLIYLGIQKVKKKCNLVKLIVMIVFYSSLSFEQYIISQRLKFF